MKKRWDCPRVLFTCMVQRGSDQTAANNEEYELKGPDAEGRGVFTDNGFLVKEGSLARREIAPSGKSVTSVHQRLIAEGVLQE